MIDFEEVKKIALEEVDNSKNLNELLENIVNRIYQKGIEDASNNFKWISVAEKLPKENEIVVALGKNLRFYIGKFSSNPPHDFLSKSDMWDGFYVAKGKKPLYWATLSDLPEDYKP